MCEWVINMIHKFLRFVTVVLSVYGVQVMAIEEAKYSVVLQEGKFEVRDYEPYLLAEVEVDGEFEEAGSKAFRSLFKYISGSNQPRIDIAMTAPVSQTSRGEEISMTAPVSQTSSAGKYIVSFMMPAEYTLQTIPQPKDPAVSIRQVKAHRMVVVSYSGLWSESNYKQNKQSLDAWVATRELKVVGEPVWARYNAPFSLWFTRRNEIMIPIAVE